MDIPAGDPRVAEPVDPVALEIAASGVDEAAAILANGIKENAGEHVIFGLQPTFLIVYGKDGKRVSGRIAMKMPEGVRPAQGVYVIPPGSSLPAASVIAVQLWTVSFGGGNDQGLGSALAILLLVLVLPFMIINVRRFRMEREQ